MLGGYALITIVILVLLFLFSAIKILNEYERAVVFRLGRVLPEPKGPGLIIIIPLVDRFVRMSLRTIVQDVPPQDVITKDNVTVKVNAVVYFRVIQPLKSVIEVENYLYATNQLSQTTLRSVCGQAELDELLAKRDEVSAHIQEILDKHTDPWGIKVSG
ncbi:MAG: SPFH domain-containing protein, partial [Desulfomonilia bacterium]|nr:SPFH domain-containing protein [Desulfomonilia bacterium]